MKIKLGYPKRPARRGNGRIKNSVNEFLHRSVTVLSSGRFGAVPGLFGVKVS